MNMKFFDCKPAPSPRRVRIFLREKGIEVPTVEVDLRGGEQLGEAFRQVNPEGTVPVLELDDGTRISEALAICVYLEEAYPQPPLFGRDARERALAVMWNGKVEQQGLLAVAELFRNRSKAFQNRALPGPHRFEQIPQLAERGQLRTELFLDRLNAHLADREYLVGEQFTIADITALVTIDFAAVSKIFIEEKRQHLRRWYDKVSSRPTIPEPGD
jgi:glutathione S-transferase